MASLSTQQSRENVDASYISYIRQPHHRFTRYHQYYQQNAVDHSTIYPIISHRGAVVSADGTRGGDSFADYDNLTPLVRLDRIVEDEADREDGSIHNVHYDNAGTRGSSDAAGVDKDRVTQTVSGNDLDDGGCYSGRRCNILATCGYHCTHQDTRGNTASSGNLPLCEYTDNKYTMGNVLFASHTGSVADSSSSSTRLGQRKRAFVESNKQQTDLGNGSAIPSAAFDREKPSIRLSEAPGMPSCSLISDTLAKEFVNAYRKDSADFGSPQEDPCSTFSNAAETRRKSERFCAVVTGDILLEKPFESIAGTSDTRPNDFDSGTSPTSASEKGNFTVPVTTKHTRSFSTTEGCRKVSDTEKKLLYNRETCIGTDDHQKIPLGETPVIIITQSTPKRQPSNTSGMTQFSDSQEQANAVPRRGLPDCTDGKKTNGVNNEYKVEANSWESQAFSSDNRHSNDRPKNDPVRSASVDASSDIPFSISDSGDKDTPEAVVLYRGATDLDKDSSYTERLAEPFKAKVMLQTTKVTDGEKLSEETRVYNSSTVAAATETSTASTVVAITNESMQLVSTTVHDSRHLTADDLKRSSYTDGHYSQSYVEKALEPAVEDSKGDYAMPYDVKKQNAIKHSQGDFINVNMNTRHTENTQKPGHATREPRHSLAESDTMSLCEPQYTEISEATEPRVKQSSLGRFRLGSDHTHYKIVRLCDPAEAHVEAAEVDAIYAVPIPKSQRKTEQSNTFTTKPALQPKQLFAEPDSPPKPARSPMYSPESTVFEDTENLCDTPVSRNKVQVTCQMKQPTTTGRFYSDSSDYDYSNIPKFGRYEFFSLGRRPKRLRSNSLRNSKEVSVSLEMMLKLRHESSSEVPVKSAADETTSVDDILRSCREFDQSQSFYRGRTSSDSTHNSYLSSLSFVEIANIKKHIHVTRESENTKLNQLTTFKINGIQNKLNGALKVNGDHATPPHVHATKHAASNSTVNFNGLQSNKVTRLNLAPVSSSQNANSIGENGQMIQPKTMPNGSASRSLGQQWLVSKETARNTPESTQLGFDPPPAGSKHAAMYNEGAKNSLTFNSKVKYVSRYDYTMHNSDYDSPETAKSDPSATSPHENLSNCSYTEDILFNEYETRKYHQISPEGTETLYSRRCFPLSSTQIPIEDGVQDKSEVQCSEVDSTTHEALRDQLLPHSITSSSVEIQYDAVTISKHGQEHRSPQETTSDISSGALITRDSAESPASSSDVTSPVSPMSLWSVSGGDFSPGIVSTHSEDAFNQLSADQLPSPTQKPSFCYARLEIVEALKWLRAAGFPQYAQMFEEGQFPVDMGVIERDHDFLDQDSLKSLFRRLEKLNKYADLSLDTLPGKKVTSEEDEEEDLCALSDRWEYKKSAGRWSRKGVTSASRHTTAMGSDQTDMTGHSESQDSLLDHDTVTPMKDGSLSEVTPNSLLHSTEQECSSPRSQVNPSEDVPRDRDLNDVFISASQIPVGNEQNKPSNNVFRKMDVLKNKRSRGMSKRRNVLDISGPIVEDSDHLRAKLERLNCVDISPSSKTAGPELSARGHASALGSRATSVERTENRRSSEFTSSHATVQSSPNSHILVQSSSTRNIRVQHPAASHILVQSASFSHTKVQSPPTSHISVKSPSSSYISVQSPSFSQFPVQSPPYSTSTATLPGHETNPHATKHPAPPNSVTLKNSTNHSGDNLSSANQTPFESHSKLDMHNQNLATQRLPSVQRDRLLENRTHDLDTQDGFSRVQDHQQPGRFPRVLDTGYTQTGYFKAEVGARNNPAQYSNTSKVEELNPYSSSRRHRNSVYDNIEPDDKQEGQDKGRMIFPGIYELENCDSGNHSKDSSEELVTSSWHSGVGVKQDKLTQDLNSEYNPSCVETVSVDFSGVDSLLRSCDQHFGSSVGDISVSVEPSPLQSPGEGAPGKETGASISETNNDTVSDSAMSKSKGVVHSSSLDSYFQGSNLSCDTGCGELTESPPRIANKEYDDFDIILQQLYQNINELSDYVSRETDINNSLEFDGALDLDPENSFSGGEGSNTAESSSEDPELVATDVSRDSLDQISSVSRERRDSGVGHSLPRPPSERRQKKLRWNSFQNSHKPDVSSRAMQINQLTVSQMVRLQKLCLLKLTAIMEKCLPVSRSGWNWMMPRFMKKQKTADFIDRKVFGVPLSVMAQRTGQPLPQCVLHAMRYLRRTSPSAVGIFRKSGVKSKIQQLRDYLEAHPDTVNFEGVNAYNVADMLKTYFRDLPECLLTNKMSEIFRSIYMHVPPSQRLEALQTAIVLLPDENREVLQSILLFLSDISSYEADHQMNANNLAVCFTPTVFQLGPQQTVTAHSAKRNHKTSIAVPDPREMMEQKAAHECLLMMILECKKLFTVFPSLYQQLQVHGVPQIMPVPLLDIGSAPSDVRSFGQERIQIILKEAHDKNRGWLPAFLVGDVEVFHRKPLDDCPLKEWKLVVEIEAPPIEVLHRILHERHVWDEDLLSWSVVDRLDPHSDIFQFVLNSMAPHPFRHFCVLRYWRSDLNKGACALITMSVEHSHPMEVQGVWAVDLGSYFLMEHCGSGRSRLTYITRLDTRGRSPEWYTRIFGHICANFLTRLKESFRQVTPGPETKV